MRLNSSFGRSLSAMVLLFAISLETPLLASAAGPSPAPQSEDGPVEEQVDITDLVARLFGRRSEDDSATPQDIDRGETRFFVFPTFGGNPAVGFSAGALATLTNHWGDPTTTPLSSMVVSATLTTKQQVMLSARSDLYAPNDTWHLIGDWRFFRFNERTHGLGSNRPDKPSAEVDYTWYRLHQLAYRPIWFGLEVGLGYHLDVHSNIRLAEEQPEPLSGSEISDSDTTTSSGLSVNLILDHRDQSLAPNRGFFGRASYTFYRTDLGSDTNWDSLQAEGRVFQRLPGRRRQTVGLWAVGWLTRAGRAPYFDLPSVGWDTYGRTARGYRAGRFRGRDWIYAELEYRTEVTRNGLIGAVAFINTSTLSDFETRDFQRWRPGGGVGARIKLDKERRSNIAVDLAWGHDGSKGLYLALNEAF